MGVRFGFVPMLIEPTIAAMRGGIVYHKRMDQQMLARRDMPARP